MFLDSTGMANHLTEDSSDFRLGALTLATFNRNRHSRIWPDRERPLRLKHHPVRRVVSDQVAELLDREPARP